MRFIYQDCYSVNDAVSAMTAVLEDGKKGQYIAGGTDLIPRIKRSVTDPDHVISLAGISGLNTIVEDNHAIHIGALVPLKEVAKSPVVQKHAPAVAQAAGKTAAPVLRVMGTIGGNIMQDRRCCYYNQSLEWHESWPACYGVGQGKICHRTPENNRCERVLMSDVVPALLLAGAKVDVAGGDGMRSVALEDILHKELGFIKLPLPSFITNITIEKKAGVIWRETYERVSVRKTIDYPEVSVAAGMSFHFKTGEVSGVEIVVGAVTPAPFRSEAVKQIDYHRPVEELGTLLGETVAEELQGRVIGTPNFSAWYKTEMIRVLISRSVRALCDPASKGV